MRSCIIRPPPGGGAKSSDKRPERGSRGGHAMTEAEVGAMQPRAQEGCRRPGA